MIERELKPGGGEKERERERDRKHAVRRETAVATSFIPWPTL